MKIGREKTASFSLFLYVGNYEYLGTCFRTAAVL